MSVNVRQSTEFALCYGLGAGQCQDRRSSLSRRNLPARLPTMYVITGASLVCYLCPRSATHLLRAISGVPLSGRLGRLGWCSTYVTA